MVIAEKGITSLHKEQSEQETDREIKELLAESEIKMINEIQVDYLELKVKRDAKEEHKLSEFQTCLSTRITTKAYQKSTFR